MRIKARKRRHYFQKNSSQIDKTWYNRRYDKKKK